jgi:hypothetical protein
MTARRLQLRCLPVFIVLLLAESISGPFAQTPSQTVVSIRLEQKHGDLVRSVPQNIVFRTGDVLRFRLTSRIAGFLYVLDKGTTGTTVTLFPGAGSAAGNRIEPNHDYLVPAEGDGWFEVSGPSGFDVLYLMVSDTPIELPTAATEGQNQEMPEAPPPPGMLPRCDDAIFKARGECIDSSAGVAPLAPGAVVPRELVPLTKTASRDIILTDDGDGTAVQPASNVKLPFIYTFRLAHRE